MRRVVLLSSFSSSPSPSRHISLSNLLHDSYVTYPLIPSVLLLLYFAFFFLLPPLVVPSISRRVPSDADDFLLYTLPRLRTRLFAPLPTLLMISVPSLVPSGKVKVLPP